jgi:transposase
MQADFTIVRRGARPLMALVATLGYSRCSSARFTDKKDADALIVSLRQAL